MLFPKLILFLPCYVAGLSASSLPSAALPSLTPLFSASIRIAPPISPLPIPIPGGIRDVQPIIGGTITGAINSTAPAGLAYPAVYENSTVEIPEIILYGTTSDGVPYLIQLSGAGGLSGQVTSVQIEIGGRYSALADVFIIATLRPNANRTLISVEGYQTSL